jgi:hypothetical protein
LSIEERRRAVDLARRCGAFAAGAAYWGSGDSCRERILPPAMPHHYGLLAPMLGPEAAQRWWRTPPACLAREPRVCTLAEGWEVARRALLKLEPVAEGRPARLAAAQRAGERFLKAEAEYRRSKAVLRRSEPAPIGSAERLAVGYAHAELIEAREEHACAVLLYRAADPAGPAVERLGEEEPFPQPVW